MPALPAPRYETFPKFRAALAEVDDAVRAEALALFIKPFHARLKHMLTSPRPGYDVRIGAGDDVLRELQDQGVALTRARPDLKASLMALTQPIVERIETHLEATVETGFKDGQILLDPAEHAPVFRAVEEIFDAARIWDISSAYAGQPLVLASVAAQVNTVGTTNRKYTAIDEVGLPKLRTNYFHIDSLGWPHHKVLIYLNDVGLDQGPFRFVTGSHRVADDFELSVRKTNDKLRIAPKHFMALPEPFRLLADFGQHMDPDSAEAQAMLARERAAYDAESDVVLFDYHGVHRGGFVRKGVRRMLQCNFVART